MRNALALSCLAFLAASLPAHGQATFVSRAESLAVVGDSARALALLDSLVRANPQDADAWNRRGMLAWAMVRHRQTHGIMDAQDISLRRMADTSLRIATQLAPDSGRYAVDLGRHFLWEGMPQMRFQAGGKFDDALEAAKRTGDSLLLASAADEVGMIAWRRYESLAHRRQLFSLGQVDPAQYVQDQHQVQSLLSEFSEPMRPPLGDDEYKQAADEFATALEADPNNKRALEHLYMALAEKSLWSEMRRRADVRLQRAPWDATSWLARGLASHELHDEGAASAAFDSALVNMPDSERSRYTDLSRVLRRGDSTQYRAMSRAQRADLERVYWTMSDPLLLTSANESRNEFLARVAYSELRWTSYDLDLHGADTDRGQIWIRYGPPDTVAAFSPAENGATPGMGIVLWYYARSGLHFFFNAPPSYGTARMSLPDAEVAEQVRATAPVSFGNLPVARRIDSIPVQTARFRAGDSVDVAVFAELPMRSLASGSDLARAPVDVGLIVLDSHARLLVRDSSRQVVDTSRANVVQDRSWRRRLAPGLVAVRVEALQPNSEHGARMQDTLRLTAETGFGMSDLLVARSVAARTDLPARWTDLLIQPSAGNLSRHQPFGVLWETYDLVPREGSASYTVHLTLERTDRSRVKELVARILGGTSGPMRASAGGQSVSLDFTRQVAARDAVVDYLTVDPGALPAGRYRLSVRITDSSTGKSVDRERSLTIVE